MSDSPAAPPSPLPTAEDQLRDFAARNPDRADAWALLGHLALRRGNPADALPHFEKATAASPDDPAPRERLAACLQAAGRLAEAADQFQRVVLLKPDWAEAHNDWGITLALCGKRAEALGAFAQAARLRPDYPEALNNWGIALIESGRPAEGLERFRQAVAANPDYPEALGNLGAALAGQGHREEARRSLEGAIRLKPDFVDAHFHLANLNRDEGRHADAEACYRLAVKHRPGHRDARKQLAHALVRQGKADEAVACLHLALLFHPDDPDAFNNLGALLAQTNRHDEAEAAFNRALALKADHADALNNLGASLLRRHRAEEAVRCLERGLVPGQPQPLCHLGNALLQAGRHQDAAARYREALALAPDHADAHFGLGNALRDLGDLEGAMACFRRAQALQPSALMPRLNEAAALTEAGRLGEASAIFEDVIRANPAFPPAHNGLGVARLHQGRPSDGAACFAEAARLEPENAEAHLNRALTLLVMGDYENGWREYEWRWKVRKAGACPHPQPAWDGRPMPHGTILLWAEQGLGDTIQFARFAALVKQRVGRVLLDCQEPLRALLAGCPGVDALAEPGRRAKADAQAPLMGLPLLLGTTVEKAPSPGQYVFADAALREKWREKVGGGPGLKVGLVWRGNPHYSGDRHRSTSLELFRPLARVPGVRLFSLQKGKGSEQLEQLGAEMGLTDLGGQITGDFRETAAAIACLDLVISVDTAVAHLAGALGVPVWIMIPFNPDWRWLTGREDSIWYPSARLFRQRQWGDWPGVVERLADALRGLARGKGPGAAAGAGLAELVEQAAREARPGAALAALRDTGASEAPEVVLLLEKLRAARQELEATEAEMEGLGDGPGAAERALALAGRVQAARRRRAEALAEFKAAQGAAG